MSKLQNLIIQILEKSMRGLLELIVIIGAVIFGCLVGHAIYQLLQCQ